MGENLPLNWIISLHGQNFQNSSEISSLSKLFSLMRIIFFMLERVTEIMNFLVLPVASLGQHGDGN